MTYVSHMATIVDKFKIYFEDFIRGDITVKLTSSLATLHSFLFFSAIVFYQWVSFQGKLKWQAPLRKLLSPSSWYAFFYSRFGWSAGADRPLWVRALQGEWRALPNPSNPAPPQAGLPSQVGSHGGQGCGQVSPGGEVSQWSTGSRRTETG